MTLIKTNDRGVRDGLLGSSFYKPIVFGGAHGLRLPQPVFEADDGTGGGGGNDDAAKAAADKAAADKAKGKVDDTKNTADKTAEILAAAEAARRAAEEKLREFDGATPAELKELRALKAKAEAAEKKAAEEAKKADEDKLRAAGDFEALKARMAEEHQKDLESVNGRAKELEGTIGTLTKQVQDMALNTAFAASRYLGEETVLTATMARKVFEDHFEVEAGRVVAYDAPRGSEKRVKLVDARGNSLAFDEAMKRIVESSPERDMILKAKMKPGSGVKPTGDKNPPPAKSEPVGLARIRLGMTSLRPAT